MKKILIILGLLLNVVLYGQVAMDSAAWTTTTTNSDYSIIGNDGPPQLPLRRMTMEYFQPFTILGGYIRPRSIANNLMLGTASNYSYKLYVNGTSYFNNDIYLPQLKSIRFGSDAYIYRTIVGVDTAAQLMFHDGYTGYKTLADLANDSSISTFDTVKIDAQKYVTKPVSGNILQFHTYPSIYSYTSAQLMNDASYKSVFGSTMLHLTPTDLRPSVASKGDIIYDASESTVYQYNGSAWAVIAGGSGTDSATVINLIDSVMNVNMVERIDSVINTTNFSINATYNISPDSILTLNGSDLGYSKRVIVDSLNIGANFRFRNNTTTMLLDLPSSTSMTFQARQLTTGYASLLNLGIVKFTPLNYYPNSPAEGETFYHNTSKLWLGYNGTRWDTLNGGTGGGGETGTLTAYGTPVSGQMAVWNSSTQLAGFDKLRYVYGTVRLINADADSGMYINNSSTGKGLSITNSSTGFGQWIVNSDGGQGIYITNSGTSSGQYIYNTSTGSGLYINNYSTGKGIYISTKDANKGIQVNDGTSDIFIVDGDSAYFPQLINPPYEQWLGITQTGGVFADSLSTAGFMLTLSPFPSIQDHMKDTKNGELAWWYQDKNGKVQKTYEVNKLRPTKQLQAFMAGIEMNKRYILDLSNDNEKLKTKVEELENRLKIIEKLLAK